MSYEMDEEKAKEHMEKLDSANAKLANRIARLNKQVSCDLEALANEAKSKAYCPRSNHPVGCAGVGKSGQVYQGCNVELPHATQHAEQVMLAQAALAGDVIERVYLTCSPCGNCRQALYEHNLLLQVAWPEYSAWSAIDLLPRPYARKNDYTPPAYVPRYKSLIDAANKALSTCQAYRSGVAEACAISAQEGNLFYAARNEFCSYPGDAFTLAYGIGLLSIGTVIPQEVCFVASNLTQQQTSPAWIGPLLSIVQLWPKCNVLFDGVRWEPGIIAGMALYRAIR